MPSLTDERSYADVLKSPAPSSTPRRILRRRVHHPPVSVFPPLPSSNGKSSNVKDKRKMFVYIDHSNFWISRKIATRDENWRYDVKALQSVLTSNTLDGEIMGGPNTKVHVYGCVPDDLKSIWENQGARVHKLKKRYPLHIEVKKTKRKRKKENPEKEVDTALVAESVTEAARALREGLKDTQIEFVIVSGDRDMRPAVKKIINCGFKVNVWSWKGVLSKAYRDLEEKKAGRLKVHLLDEHKDKFVTASKVPVKQGFGQAEGSGKNGS
ncbi:hypothetical protein CEP54_015639 [Fusarium duplospermum]|uniref:NYN domain-containing protein n=1 Tax=Fusarium duplospermum TaxID=1325734 RepID=A0A428NMK7_9HYPO|nr:hypothetical protein CEP54_015639 [Fusarium duplospermum]